MIVKNDLYDYKNRYIFQDNEGFKFSLDSILLAEYASFNNDNKLVLDMCSGNAAIPLIMSCYNNSKYVGFEIQKDIFDLGIKSIEYNKLSDRVRLINDDINNIGNYYNNGIFDIITCNPPFFQINDKKVINENEKKAIARHELKLKLEKVFEIANKYLKDNGSLYIVHRPERLDELFIYANKHNLNIKKVQLICTKEGQAPSMVLVKCNKNSKIGVVISSVLCIQNLDSYQNIFKEQK